MDYSDMSEGYGTEQIPFRPAQWQNAPVDYSYPAPPRRPAPTPARTQGNAQKRMPKAQALTLVRHLKQTLVVGSLLCFGATSGLIINQAMSASQQTTAPATSSKTTTSTTSQSSSQTSATSRQAGATSQQSSSTPTSTASTSSQQQGGGYGFGSTSTSQPVSQSHASPSRHTP